MGIGNTSCAAAIAAAILKAHPDSLTGPGVGIDEATRRHKTDVIAQALEQHLDILDNPLEILRCLGGRKLAAMTGASVPSQTAIACRECGSTISKGTTALVS